MTTKMVRRALRALLCSTALVAAAAHAEATYLAGRISNVTFSGDSVMIMLDTGVPGNCVGTPFGWMRIPAANKPMTAFVIGLWLKGDASAVQVTVYTDPPSSSAFCTVHQLDPAE